MLPELVAALRCPICRGTLADGGGSLACAGGHTFDVARHGYVSFLAGRPSGLVGDDAAMVDARARFLGAGHFDPLAAALVESLGAPPPGLVVDAGAGTGWYLARALDALPGRLGLALDLSKFAARRAARAHPRAGAACADLRAPLPLADGCAALVLDVFAPRNGGELRRILARDGRLLVVTPAAEHLAELRAPLGLLDVDPDKERRVAAALEPSFQRTAAREVAWRMSLPRADALALAGMGPSARHLDAAALSGRAAALPDPLAVSGACLLETWRPRP